MLDIEALEYVLDKKEVIDRRARSLDHNGLYRNDLVIIFGIASYIF